MKYLKLYEEYEQLALDLTVLKQNYAALFADYTAFKKWVQDHAMTDELFDEGEIYAYGTSG